MHQGSLGAHLELIRQVAQRKAIRPRLRPNSRVFRSRQSEICARASAAGYTSASGWSPMEAAVSNRVRLGAFELDLKAGELRTGDRKVRLQEQPFQILLMLVERAGGLVTREEIKKKLWPNDTVVEFDHSIHTAINKLRQAFGDSAENPKYIETVARRGYRLMVRVERVDVGPVGPPLAASGTRAAESLGSSLSGKRVS